MAESKHVAILKEGVDAWNSWRAREPRVRPDLSQINFEKDVWEGSHFYDVPHYHGLDLSGVRLNGVVLRNSYLEACKLDGATISFADLCFSEFIDCSFLGVEMRVTRIGSAAFAGCTFVDSDLSYCTAEETDFSGSTLIDTSLSHMSLVKTRFENSHLERVDVYGISAWDLDLTDATQKEIQVGPDRIVSVDNVEIAQFIYVLLRSAKLRDVIDTITSKVVLILGRFTEERRLVLEGLREELSSHGYVPVLFDFPGPESRDLTETVSLLAHMSRFVVVDLSDPRSVPHELASVVPRLPSVPFQPIIVQGERPYGMFEHFTQFPWVLPLQQYNADKTAPIAAAVIQACERHLQGNNSEES